MWYGVALRILLLRLKCDKMQWPHPDIPCHASSQPDVSGIATGAATYHNNLSRCCRAESFAPQPCPFLDAYTFSYNNNTGGPCRQPVSTATPCSSQSQYRLHFQHCPAYAHTYDRGTPAQQLVCRQRYLVLKLNSALYSRLHLSNLRYTL